VHNKTITKAVKTIKWPSVTKPDDSGRRLSWRVTWETDIISISHVHVTQLICGRHKHRNGCTLHNDQWHN